MIYKRRTVLTLIVCVILATSLELTNVTNVDSKTELIPHRSSVSLHTLKSINDHQTIPDCVEVGDLMLLDIASDESTQWKQSGLYNEHGGIYIGNNTLIDSGVATVPNGVHAYNYSFFYHYQKNFVFFRVKTANESQRQAAAAWAISKIGTPYQFFYQPPWFGLKIANPHLPLPTADAFYCMELLWAAYYNQGIDIDQNGWRFPWWVTGDDILADADIEIIYRNVTNSTEII